MRKIIIDPKRSQRQPARNSVRLWNDVFYKFSFVALLILVWQLLLTVWLPSYLPSPLGTFLAFIPTAVSSEFIAALFSTLIAIVLGLLIGCSVGISLGILMGLSSTFRRLLVPYVNGFYALPLLVLIPAITIWLGYSSEARLALIIFSVILSSAVSTSDGVRHIPQQYLDVSRVLKIRRLEHLFGVVLPASIAYIVAGVQISIGRAVVACVAVEFIANVQGLGVFIQNNARSFHQNEAFVGLITLAVVGVVAKLAFDQIVQIFAPWRMKGAM